MDPSPSSPPQINEQAERERLRLQNVTRNLLSMVAEMEGDSSANRLPHAKVQGLIKDLPRLTEKQVTELGHKDSLCPICFVPYLSLLAEEETALVMDSPAHPVEELGVTRLAKSGQCGHLFCRRDISKWIQDRHDSCPLCRHSLIASDSSSNTTSNINIQEFPVETRQLDINPDTFGREIYDILTDAELRSNTRGTSSHSSEFSGMYS